MSSPKASVIPRAILCCSLMLMVFGAQAQDAENTDDLLSQIQSLQSRMKIQITGLEKIGNEEKVSSGGSLDQQLVQVLGAYNHIISRNSKGQIEQVVIINKKQKTDVDRIILPTRYENGHFLVSVSVSGNGALWETLDMIIDTGADLIVLPESMIENLGIADNTFTTRKMQTANGEVNAQVGTLQEVRIAGEILENVTAAFIPDQLLANNSLLGMSALGRYKLIIDDQSRVITLFKK
ncbi:MAG: retropepsin-like aspartic protease family protein [Methylovulum sp.]